MNPLLGQFLTGARDLLQGIGGKLAPLVPPAPQILIPAETAPHAVKRVLIVDDAATVRLYHRTILEAGGYAVEEAVNGVEALEKSLRAPFDLYLVDVNPPQQDGYGFLRELRGHDLPQAPAIMVSTGAAAHDRKLAQAIGANHHLVKPVQPEQLLMPARLLLGEESP